MNHINTKRKAGPWHSFQNASKQKKDLRCRKQHWPKNLKAKKWLLSDSAENGRNIAVCKNVFGILDVQPQMDCHGFHT